MNRVSLSSAKPISNSISELPAGAAVDSTTQAALVPISAIQKQSSQAFSSSFEARCQTPDLNPDRNSVTGELNPSGLDLTNLFEQATSSQARFDPFRIPSSLLADTRQNFKRDALPQDRQCKLNPAQEPLTTHFLDASLGIPIFKEGFEDAAKAMFKDDSTSFSEPSQSFPPVSLESFHSSLDTSAPQKKPKRIEEKTEAEGLTDPTQSNIERAKTKPVQDRWEKQSQTSHNKKNSDSYDIESQSQGKSKVRTKDSVAQEGDFQLAFGISAERIDKAIAYFQSQEQRFTIDELYKRFGEDIQVSGTKFRKALLARISQIKFCSLKIPSTYVFSREEIACFPQEMRDSLKPCPGKMDRKKAKLDSLEMQTGSKVADPSASQNFAAAASKPLPSELDIRDNLDLTSNKVDSEIDVPDDHAAESQKRKKAAPYTMQSGTGRKSTSEEDVQFQKAFDIPSQLIDQAIEDFKKQISGQKSITAISEKYIKIHQKAIPTFHKAMIARMAQRDIPLQEMPQPKSHTFTLEQIKCFPPDMQALQRQKRENNRNKYNEAERNKTFIYNNQKK